MVRPTSYSNAGDAVHTSYYSGTTVQQTTAVVVSCSGFGNAGRNGQSIW